jgi:hypothetical protein
VLRRAFGLILSLCLLCGWSNQQAAATEDLIIMRNGLLALHTCCNVGSDQMIA